VTVSSSPSGAPIATTGAPGFGTAIDTASPVIALVACSSARSLSLLTLTMVADTESLPRSSVTLRPPPFHTWATTWKLVSRLALSDALPPTLNAVPVKSPAVTR
jgi:hypothetical protein